MSVMLATSLGDIVIDLHTDRCPLTCKNFLKLCKIKYYNHCLFHSVQKDFIAQTGDPSGKGTGGDSIYKFLYGDQARFFSDEIHPDLKHSKVGTVAMASAGENLNASQFYITLREELDYLDGKHTVFAEVAEGLDTLMRINETFVDEKGRPYKNIRIKHTYILDDPFDDPPQIADLIPENSPEQKPPEEGEEVRLEDDWVPMDEQQDPEELEQSLRKKEAHSRAVVLEMVGDIPEAEVKPPENVLFVCKLNPVTQEEDLEVIFSRFGKVISADIIRDYKTGDSLCYAFVEFETNEACEAAYFKMDNVLIDDRRIHVDFSQSVSKLWNQYRRAGRKNAGDEGKGRGCFKCGELGHIAKECPQDSDGVAPKGAAQEKPKYVLKDTNRQHGDTGKSYDMIFDNDTPATSSRKSQHEDHGLEKPKEMKGNAKEINHDNKEREPEHYERKERGNKGREKEMERGCRENRDIERYENTAAREGNREDRKRESSTDYMSRNRERYGNRERYVEEKEIQRHRYKEDRERDTATVDRSRCRERYGDRDKNREERESKRHLDDRERDRSTDDRNRNRERHGENRDRETYKNGRESRDGETYKNERESRDRETFKNERESNRHREDRERDRFTTDQNRDKDKYGENRDRYREDRDRKRHQQMEPSQRDREGREVEDRRGGVTYKPQKDEEINRDYDRGTKRQKQEQERQGEKDRSRSEKRREDLPRR